jgi:hypothetical protein
MAIDARIPNLDWPRSAADLLAQAKAESAGTGELVRLVMGGIRRLDSWLIENRVLPALAGRNIKILEFSLDAPHHERRLAAIIPLPDGSAFACSSSGRWSDLDAHEAMAAIQYVGSRYAPGNHWGHDFLATARTPGAASVPATPPEVAAAWEEVTGTRPHGFQTGVLDQVHAFGLHVLDRAFNSHGLLGL